LKEFCMTGAAVVRGRDWRRNGRMGRRRFILGFGWCVV
jgi:hypothetical protein